MFHRDPQRGVREEGKIPSKSSPIGAKAPVKPPKGGVILEGVCLKSLEQQVVEVGVATDDHYTNLTPSKV